METVNRASVVVTLKEPYLAWARSLEDDAPIDDSSRDELTTIYLVNADAENFDREDILRQHWRAIFDEQLHSWNMDRPSWPKNRTVTMFLEWFDVRIVELVYDLGQGTLDRDD